MKPYKSVRAVLFDFGGTLDSDGINWKDRFYPFYLKAGLKFSYSDYEKYFYYADDYLTERNLKKQSFQKTLEWQVSLVLKEANARQKSLVQKISQVFLKDSILQLQKNLILMKKLKARYKLGIVSNFYGNLKTICNAIGYDAVFDVIVDSNRAGALKPDPKIFFEALHSLGCHPEEAVFVGDSVLRDMKGAKATGMPHIWLKAKGLKAVQDLKPCCPNDPIIHSLAELSGILLPQ